MRKNYGHSHYRHGSTTISFGRWNGSSSLALNCISTKIANWLECTGKSCISLPSHPMVVDFDVRYLHYLSDVRVQHLQRICTFASHRMKETKKPNSERKAAFNLSLSFLKFAIREASATQSLADALSCVSPCFANFHTELCE